MASVFIEFHWWDIGAKRKKITPKKIPFRSYLSLTEFFKVSDHSCNMYDVTTCTLSRSLRKIGWIADFSALLKLEICKIQNSPCLGPQCDVTIRSRTTKFHCFSRAQTYLVHIKSFWCDVLFPSYSAKSLCEILTERLSEKKWVFYKLTIPIKIQN